MTARLAAAVTPREARRRPAELHGARGVAERIRPVLASLADPALGVPRRGRRTRPGQGVARRRRAPSWTPPPGPSGTASPPSSRPPPRPHSPPPTPAPSSPAPPAAPPPGSARCSPTSSRPPRAAAPATDADPLLRPTLLRLVPVALRTMRAELGRRRLTGPPARGAGLRGGDGRLSPRPRPAVRPRLLGADGVRDGDAAGLLAHLRPRGRPVRRHPRRRRAGHRHRAAHPPGHRACPPPSRWPARSWRIC